MMNAVVTTVSKGGRNVTAQIAHPSGTVRVRVAGDSQSWDRQHAAAATALLARVEGLGYGAFRVVGSGYLEDGLRRVAHIVEPV